MPTGSQSKLRGIVLHSIKYGDTSLITHIYTDLHGRQVYLLKGIRGAAARHRSSLIQPLFLLNIEAYGGRQRGAMRYAKELQANTPLHSLPSDVRKSAIALFVGEVLYSLIREEEQNAALFDFLYRHILLLDSLQQGVANFHLYFLVQLAQHLGFWPGNTYDAGLRPYFDAESGLFAPSTPLAGAYMDKPTAALMAALLAATPDNLHHIRATREQRNLLLRMVLDYYCAHLGMANPIRSLAVLEEVFR
jgi:DNA repair protein RecO (recombination protein O)